MYGLLQIMDLSVSPRPFTHSQHILFELFPHREINFHGDDKLMLNPKFICPILSLSTRNYF